MMDYTLVRSARKTIAIHITPEGTVEVRCPKRMSRAEVQRFVDSKQDWIEKHLKAIAERPALPALTPEALRTLAKQAAQVIPARTAHYAPIVGVTYGRITIRAQHTRWGSCSAKGNLNFNCLLMLTPPEVLDYVVVHELCHRKELNHSPKFWAEVERVMPDYDKHRQWLKQNGASLIGRLPKVSPSGEGYERSSL